MTIRKTWLDIFELLQMKRIQHRPLSKSEYIVQAIHQREHQWFLTVCYGGLVLVIELFTWYAFIHIWHDGDKQASANDKTRIHFTVITLHLFIFYSDCMSHIKFSCYTHMIYHIIYLITSNISSIRRQKEPIINVLSPVQYIINYLYYLWRLLYLVTYHDKPFCWHKFVAWPWWHFDFELIAW